VTERNKGGRPPGDPNHQRRGNGAGWGGPAKGEGNAAKGLPGPGRGVTGKTVAELMAAQGAREEAADRWMAILRDPTHPKHADMVAKAADRLDGAPTQRLDVREADPNQMTDAELAAIASRGRRAPAGEAEATE
jgi:hypothetical protein